MCKLFLCDFVSADTELDVQEKWQQQPTTVCVVQEWPITLRLEVSEALLLGFLIGSHV